MLTYIILLANAGLSWSWFMLVYVIYRTNVEELEGPSSKRHRVFARNVKLVDVSLSWFMHVGLCWSELVYVGVFMYVERVDLCMLVCVGLSWSMLVCLCMLNYACVGPSRLIWPVIVYVGLCWYGLACVGLYQSDLACDSLCWSDLVNVGMGWPVLVYTGLIWPVIVYVGLI